MALGVERHPQRAVGRPRLAVWHARRLRPAHRPSEERPVVDPGMEGPPELDFFDLIEPAELELNHWAVAVSREAALKFWGRSLETL